MKEIKKYNKEFQALYDNIDAYFGNRRDMYLVKKYVVETLKYVTLIYEPYNEVEKLKMLGMNLILELELAYDRWFDTGIKNEILKAYWDVKYNKQTKLKERIDYVLRCIDLWNGIDDNKVTYIREVIR